MVVLTAEIAVLTVTIALLTLANVYLVYVSL
jgi:hypothetical protein